MVGSDVALLDWTSNRSSWASVVSLESISDGKVSLAAGWVSKTVVLCGLCLVRVSIF